MNKFEQLLDLIVNEEQDKAAELFHEIVVEKSRDIYENLIAEEEVEEEATDEAVEEEAVEEEATDESVEEVEETFEIDEADDDMDMGGDAADDFVSDVEADDAGEEGDEEAPATKGDVQDLEDALEELKAEFEALLSGDDSADDEGAEDDMGDEEEGDEESENPFEGAEEEGEMVREYRETVAKPSNVEQGDGKGGPVASGKGKPTSDANGANLVQGGEESGGNHDGLAGKVKGEFTKGVEKNIASSSKASMKNGADLSGEGKAYGAGGAATSETGAGNTDSIVGS